MQTQDFLHLHDDDDAQYDDVRGDGVHDVGGDVRGGGSLLDFQIFRSRIISCIK